MKKRGYSNEEWSLMIRRLSGMRHTLTKEEEEIIKEIVKKYSY